MIPAGCTGLVQPLEVSINRPFKDILRNITEQDIIEKEGSGLEKWLVSNSRVSTTWYVGKAWEEFAGGPAGRTIIQNSFKNVGLALLVDGLHDHTVNIKVFLAEDMAIGDWTLRGPPELVGEYFHIVEEDDDENSAVDYIHSQEI
ncbi:hypothetical protein HOY82DRAFT_537484 [Tuber indicum]|nr:hypothetical protein HOY82DRAFT_537484 [Tuber indicum]